MTTDVLGRFQAAEAPAQEPGAFRIEGEIHGECEPHNLGRKKTLEDAIRVASAFVAQDRTTHSASVFDTKDDNRVVYTDGGI